MKTFFFITLSAVLLGCTADSKHREYFQVQEDIFNRQKYERRFQPALEETDAFFSFTNRLAQRDKEPIDLEDLGKAMVETYGPNISWLVVKTAYADYSQGAPLDKATNVMWLLDQSPRVRDTAWMIHFRDQWLPK